ncbi:hypothetical protein TNCV_3171191 [Trichonephila clavipes]|nr:hypothetical protein TNCV_3171191 [Trichonephila clavipes]
MYLIKKDWKHLGANIEERILPDPMLRSVEPKDFPRGLVGKMRIDSSQKERSEIPASDSSKEARTARLEEKTSENAFF